MKYAKKEMVTIWVFGIILIVFLIIIIVVGLLRKIPSITQKIPLWMEAIFETILRLIILIIIPGKYIRK